MDKKTKINKSEQQFASGKGGKKKGDGKANKPLWMSDPKKAAVQMSRSRKLRGCYSLAVITLLIVITIGVIYVTLR
jgi:hypothetical protein